MAKLNLDRGVLRDAFRRGHELGTYLPSRLSGLQTGNHESLFVLGALPTEDRAVERELHDRFDRSWIRGEWFMPSDDLLAYIGTLQ